MLKNTATEISRTRVIYYDTGIVSNSEFEDRLNGHMFDFFMVSVNLLHILSATICKETDPLVLVI